MHLHIMIWLQVYGGQGVEHSGMSENGPYRLLGVTLLGAVTL